MTYKGTHYNFINLYRKKYCVRRKYSNILKYSVEEMESQELDTSQADLQV